MFTKPTDETNNPLVGSKSEEESNIQNVTKSPHDSNKKTGRALLAATMLVLVACSSLGILCHHSSHDAEAKGVVVSETTEGIVNEAASETTDDLESEVSMQVLWRTFETCLQCATKSVSYTFVFCLSHHKSVLVGL